MNFKDVYFGALPRFKRRNADVLPLVQLQYGKNERWFVREFALAINQHLNPTRSPRVLRQFASCEYGYSDISIWSQGSDTASFLVEAKALYSGSRGRKDILLRAAVERARLQLEEARVGRVSKEATRVGLFFVVLAERRKCTRAEVAGFRDAARAAIRTHFSSDHNIRLTTMCKPSSVAFGDETWTTASWVTWGRLR